MYEISKELANKYNQLPKEHFQKLQSFSINII